MTEELFGKNIKGLFCEGVASRQQGELPIISNDNGRDCMISHIPAKANLEFKENFEIGDEETILLARDTSPWNNRKEGLVITNKQIIYIPDHLDKSSSKYIIKMADTKKVTYDNKAIIFWRSEETFLPIPLNYFFKARSNSYDIEAAGKNLASLLDKLCHIA